MIRAGGFKKHCFDLVCRHAPRLKALDYERVGFGGFQFFAENIPENERLLQGDVMIAVPELIEQLVIE